MEPNRGSCGSGTNIAFHVVAEVVEVLILAGSLHGTTGVVRQSRHKW